MNRFEREHVEGLRGGLSIAVRIMETSHDMDEAMRRARSQLREARLALDLDNIDIMRRLTCGLTSPVSGAKVEKRAGQPTPLTGGPRSL